jgi:hypothetical protein
LLHNLSSVYFVNQPICFRHICSPSSGGTLYVYNWYMCFLVDSLLTGLRWNSIPTRSTDSQLKSTTHTICCIYIYSIPPDDGLQICLKHIEVYLQNKLRIDSASSWFLLHRCIKMQGQQNIKFSKSISYSGPL